MKTSAPTGTDERDQLIERLKLEAQAHAQEARTANATIAEIYRVVTGGTGEPGRWNGAENLQVLTRKANAEKHNYFEPGS